MNYLFTGFEPFADHNNNPTSDLILRVQKLKSHKNHDLQTLILPVDYQKAFDMTAKSLEANDSDVIICFGLAADRSVLTFEKIALNWRQAKIADNAGAYYAGEKIDASASAGLFTTLNYSRFQEVFRTDFPSLTTSYCPGAYVCNDLLFQLLKNYPKKKIGFIHLPKDFENSIESMASLLRDHYRSLE